MLDDFLVKILNESDDIVRIIDFSTSDGADIGNSKKIMFGSVNDRKVRTLMEKGAISLAQVQVFGNWITPSSSLTPLPTLSSTDSL